MPLASEVLVALVTGAAAFFAVAALLGLGHQISVTESAGPMRLSRFVLTAAAFLPMALWEEFIFRWLLIGQLYKVIGIIPAFLIATASFVGVHRPNGRLGFIAVLNLAIVGVVLGLVFWRWGIWVAAGAHAGWNLAEWGLGFAVSGQKTRQLLPAPVVREVKGEPFGPEGHWAATLVLLAALAGLALLQMPRF